MNGTKFQLFSYDSSVNYLNIFSVTKVDKRQINFAGIKIFVTKSLNQFCQLILVCYQNMHPRIMHIEMMQLQLDIKMQSDMMHTLEACKKIHFV